MPSKPSLTAGKKTARAAVREREESVAVASTPVPDASAYRRIALSFPDAVESSHMGAPDFRINGRIFATLAYGAKGLGTLKLTPEQQVNFLAEAPEIFSAAPGGWGRMGMTLVRIDAPVEVLTGALSTAYRHVLSKEAAKASGRTAAKSSASTTATRARRT